MKEPEFKIGDRVMGATGINGSYVDAIIEGTITEIEILGNKSVNLKSKQMSRR